MVDLIELYERLKDEFLDWTVKIYVSCIEDDGVDGLCVLLEHANGVKLKYYVPFVELIASRFPDENIVFAIKNRIKVFEEGKK